MFWKDIQAILVDNGVNLEVETMQGNRAIHYICRLWKDINAIRLLIDKDVDIEIEDSEHRKPMSFLPKETLDLLHQENRNM